MGVYCSLGVYWNLLSSEKKKEQKINTNWKELKKKRQTTWKTSMKAAFGLSE